MIIILTLTSYRNMSAIIVRLSLTEDLKRLKVLSVNSLSFFLGSFNDILNCSDYIVSNYKKIVYKLERMQRK
jgi:hypothetical protein